MKFNRLIPELSVSDLKKSAEFYTAIGFKIRYQREEDMFMFLEREGAQLMIQEHNQKWETAPLESPLGRGMNLQIEVNDIQHMIATLKNMDYPLFRTLENASYKTNSEMINCQEILVLDPDGYLLRFSQEI